MQQLVVFLPRRLRPSSSLWTSRLQVCNSSSLYLLIPDLQQLQLRCNANKDATSSRNKAIKYLYIISVLYSKDRATEAKVWTAAVSVAEMAPGLLLSCMV